MPRVVATHPVGNMDTWLAGGEERADLQKLQAVLADPETEKAKSRHTVLEPVDLYIEVEGGR
jgi:hypothetical protein